jgi:cell division protein FtsW (lipid II flippase)
VTAAGATTGTPENIRTRRNTELFLLILALLIVLAAYANVGLAIDGSLPADMISYGAGLGTLFFVAHIAVRRFAAYADPIMLPAAAFLNGLGLVLIHRLDLAGKQGTGGAAAQLLWTTLGIGLFVAVLVVVRDHRLLQRYTYIGLFVGLALLLLPLTPIIGKEINGARIWIRFAGFSFQPAELAKLVLIGFFAGYLVVKRDVLARASRRQILGFDLPRGRDMGPILVAWLVSMFVLIFQRDLGTALLFFGLFVAMLYIATERRSWLILGLGLFALGGYAAYIMFSHVKQRIDIWLDPFQDETGAGFQLVQALYGLANGGVVGTGLGQGRPTDVPFAKTDFILATIGEELGLTGLMAVLICYAILVERGFRTAVAARDPFGKLLAAGLAFTLGLQVFIIAGGVLRVIPLTGLTTPFVSYGGSSLVANWALVALLIRISDAARRPAPVAPPPDEAVTQVVKT